MAVNTGQNHVSDIENVKAPFPGKKLLGLRPSNRPILGEIGNRVGGSVNLETTKNAIFKRPVNPTLCNNTNKIQLPPQFEKIKHETKKEINALCDNPNISKLSISVKEELPVDVENIDKNDDDSLILVSVYVNDIYSYLRSVEDKYIIKEKYLTGHQITPKSRAILIDWLVDVQEQCKLQQETLQRSVTLIDLYLQDNHSIIRENLQLVGVSAFFIASKYEEIYPPELKELVYMTDNACSKNDILEMEISILKSVSFELGWPVPINFLRRYSRVAKVKPIHHAFAKYFLDLALVEYSLVHVKPSLIAAAALFISLCVVSSIDKNGVTIDLNLWSPTLKYFSTYKFQDFAHIIPEMAKIISKVRSSRLQAVFEKYSSSKNLKVSLSSVLKPDSEIFKSLLQL